MVEIIKNSLPQLKSLEDERVYLMGKNSSELNFFEIYTYNVAVVLTRFITSAAPWLESVLLDQNAESALNWALKIIAQLTEIKNINLFKVCIEFWLFFVNFTGSLPSTPLNNSPLKQVAVPALQLAVQMIVTRVPKPQEILIFIDEDGIPRREQLNNNENADLYTQVKQIMRLYARDHWLSLQQILNYKLEMINGQTVLNYESLNSVCWAVGTLPGAINFEDEKKFLIVTLKILLSMCANRPTTEQKSVVASNIMHIVSQNQKFLQTNFELLQIVVKKLFEFMVEKYEGVPEMACNTFVKIAENLKAEFVIARPTKEEPRAIEFIQVVLAEAQNVMPNLGVIQKLQLFEAIGQLISAEPTAENCLAYLESATAPVMKVWAMASQNNKAILCEEKFVDELILFIRACERLCFAVGVGFLGFFNKYFSGLPQLYNEYYEILASRGSGLPVEDYQSKKYKAVRKEIMNLLKTYVAHWEKYPAQFLQNYQALYPFVIESYLKEANHLKENEVLSFLAESIRYLGRDLTVIIAVTLPALIQNILPLISSDFNAHIETRTHFFRLLQEISNHCFEVFT